MKTDYEELKKIQHFERVVNVYNVCWDSGIYGLMGLTEKARIYKEFHWNARIIIEHGIERL